MIYTPSLVAKAYLSKGQYGHAIQESTIAKSGSCGSECVYVLSKGLKQILQPTTFQPLLTSNIKHWAQPNKPHKEQHNSTCILNLFANNWNKSNIWTGDLVAGPSLCEPLAM